MKILIFGGTTEGRMLAQTISEFHKDRYSVTVSVATSVGAHELAGINGIKVIVGRLDEEEMVRLFLEKGSDRGCEDRADMHLPYDLVVDATHPYAVEVSANIRSAAARTGVHCVRLLRTDDDGEIRGTTFQDSDMPSTVEKKTREQKIAGREDRGLKAGRTDCDAVYVDSASSAAAYLADTEGRILLTTGSKELGSFREIPADRLYVRVLPTVAGIAACEHADIPYRNVIAMVGPFSQEMNAATMRQYQIAWMVTKDSGKAGGFDEKMEACRETGARPVVIARPKECGLSMREVLALIG